MEKLVGFNKPLEEQIKILESILLENEKLKEVLTRLQKTSITEFTYYVGAGAINQTIFNYYHDYPLDYGIKDFDIVYFDSDTSYEAEDKIIKELEKVLNDIDIEFDIKNQARVHLWYNEKYHTKKVPYGSCEDAISSWGTTVTCIGVRLENKKMVVFAPYGLNDLFSMTIRPVKKEFTKQQYENKISKWKQKWSMLSILPYDK